MTIEQRSLLRASAAPAVGTTLSRITGLGRVVALAWALGQSGVSDGYNLANTAPNLLYELVLGGVLSSTLVPLFVPRSDDDSSSGQRSADERASVVLSVGLVVLAAISVMAVVAAPLLVHLFPGSSGGPNGSIRTQVAEPLLYLLLPQILFYGVTSIGTAILHARRNYVVAAFAPVATNLITIVAVLLVPTIDGGGIMPGDTGPIYLLGLGTTLGVAAMAFFVVRGVRDSGADIRWRFEPRHPVLTKIVRLSGWTIGYVASNQIALLIILAFAASLGDGAVTAYQTAFIFFQLPHGLLAVSIMTSTTPELSAAAADRDLDRLALRFREGLGLLITLMIPAALGLVILAEPLVTLLLERGRFDHAATLRTAEILQMMAIGLPAFSIYLYCQRVFYAFQDTRTPFMLNLFENTLNVIAAWAFLNRGPGGLGLAYSVAYIAGVVVSIAAVTRRWPTLLDRSMAPAVGRMLLAAGFSVAAVLATRSILWSTLLARHPLLDVLVSTVMGAITLFVAVSALRVEGFESLRRSIDNRFGSGRRS